MSFNHRDIVIFFSKLISTLINYTIVVLFIIGIGILVFGFYQFVVKELKPDPNRFKHVKKQYTTYIQIPGYEKVSVCEKLVTFVS